MSSLASFATGLGFGVLFGAAIFVLFIFPKALLMKYKKAKEGPEGGGGELQHKNSSSTAGPQLDLVGDAVAPREVGLELPATATSPPQNEAAAGAAPPGSSPSEEKTEFVIPGIKKSIPYKWYAWAKVIKWFVDKGSLIGALVLVAENQLTITLSLSLFGVECITNIHHFFKKTYYPGAVSNDMFSLRFPGRCFLKKFSSDQFSILTKLEMSFSCYFVIVAFGTIVRKMMAAGDAQSTDTTHNWFLLFSMLSNLKSVAIQGAVFLVVVLNLMLYLCYLCFLPFWIYYAIKSELTFKKRHDLWQEKMDKHKYCIIPPSEPKEPKLRALRAEKGCCGMMKYKLFEFGTSREPDILFFIIKIIYEMI